MDFLTGKRNVCFQPTYIEVSGLCCEEGDERVGAQNFRIGDKVNNTEIFLEFQELCNFQIERNIMHFKYDGCAMSCAS